MRENRHCRDIKLMSAGWFPQFHLGFAGAPRTSVGHHHADARTIYSMIPLSVLSCRVIRAVCDEHGWDL
jgi:hypothetical protein